MVRAQVSKNAIRSSYLEQAKLTRAHSWLALAMPGLDTSGRLEQLQANAFEIVLKQHDELAGATVTQSAMRDLLHSATLDDLWTLEGADRLFVKGVISDPSIESNFLDADIRFVFLSEPALKPPIAKIEIAMTGRAEKPNAPADLIKSRLLSTNHRWHTLVEDPNRSPEPFMELLGERFRMEFGHGSVNSFDELRQWVYGSASSVNASRHELESMSWRRLSPNEFEAIFILDWRGLTRNDKIMTAKTKHIWTLSDDLSELYPRIQHMHVQFLEPFAVIE